MTAVTGCNIRNTENYWELSGPKPINRIVSCRACKGTVFKNSNVYVRDGRKLRFFYHEQCFTGNEDPRTQVGATFMEKEDYHKKLAPNISSLEGPRACKDSDGRVLGRSVFKSEAPKTLGAGKWSVKSRGYNPVKSNDTNICSFSAPRSTRAVQGFSANKES